MRLSSFFLPLSLLSILSLYSLSLLSLSLSLLSLSLYSLSLLSLSLSLLSLSLLSLYSLSLSLSTLAKNSEKERKKLNSSFSNIRERKFGSVQKKHVNPIERRRTCLLFSHSISSILFPSFFQFLLSLSPFSSCSKLDHWQF